MTIWLLKTNTLVDAMADRLHIRPMTTCDIRLGMRLKSQAGWNQTEADWRRFIDLQPHGCFVAQWDAAAVGTVTTCRFGSVGWIAMMLVDTQHRRQGIGTALMRRALGALQDEGATTIRLDATPLGKPLYEKLGFRPQFELVRLAGVPEAARPADGTLPLAPEDCDGILGLDARAVGVDRSRLLRRLVGEQPDGARCVLRNGQPLGYLLSRPGTRATQIGPGIAEEEAAGRALLTDMLSRQVGAPVFVDVPTENEDAIGAAKRAGLAPQRSLIRMIWGEESCERIDCLWASSGPEKG